MNIMLSFILDRAITVPSCSSIILASQTPLQLMKRIHLQYIVSAMDDDNPEKARGMASWYWDHGCRFLDKNVEPAILIIPTNSY